MTTMKLVCKLPYVSKGFLSILAIICAFSTSTAQATLSLTGAGNEHDIESWLSRNKLRNFGDEKNFVGERFFNGTWLTGTLQTNDGIVVKNVDLKYDLVLDQLIVKMNGTSFVLRSSSVGEFVLNHDGERLFFKSIIVDNKPGFYQVLYSKGSNVMAKHSTKIIKRDAGNQAYGSGVAYDKYVASKEFYVSKGAEPPVKLKVSKKSISNFLPDHSDEVLKYIKSTNIDLKSDQGVISVFEYYDQISR